MTDTSAQQECQNPTCDGPATHERVVGWLMGTWPEVILFCDEHAAAYDAALTAPSEVRDA